MQRVRWLRRQRNRLAQRGGHQTLCLIPHPAPGTLLQMIADSVRNRPLPVQAAAETDFCQDTFHREVGDSEAFLAEAAVSHCAMSRLARWSRTRRRTGLQFMMRAASPGANPSP